MVKSNGAGGFTMRVTVVERATEPNAEIVNWYVPAGVFCAVWTVSVDEKGGVPEAGENAYVVFTGKPVTASATFD